MKSETQEIRIALPAMMKSTVLWPVDRGWGSTPEGVICAGSSLDIGHDPPGN